MHTTVTLQQVAAASGVSVATASRALTGKNRVSAETIARVKEVADRLGYHVNPIARALREGSTRLIGMVVPVIGNPFYSQLLDAVEQVSHERGFELLVADSHAHVDEESRRLRVLADRKVDGILLAPTESSDAPGSPLLAGANVPVVQIDRMAAPDTADFVGVDNATGISLLMDHLALAGARRIMYVGADDVNNNGRERWAAFQARAAELGVEIVAPHRDAFDVATGRTAAGLLVGQRDIPDAVVAGSDLIAFGLVAGLRAHGIEAPRDILITGFDGTEMSEIFSPSLTTVLQPLDDIAHEAVRFLQERMDGSSVPWRSSRIVPRLRVGTSTSR